MHKTPWENDKKGKEKNMSFAITYVPLLGLVNCGFPIHFFCFPIEMILLKF